MRTHCNEEDFYKTLYLRLSKKDLEHLKQGGVCSRPLYGNPKITRTTVYIKGTNIYLKTTKVRDYPGDGDYPDE